MADSVKGLVARAFDLLGCFDDEHVELTLTEMARRSELPVNTTLRIARSLVDAGALERDHRGRFTLGLRMYEFAALAPRGAALRPTALPYLQDLHALTGHHAVLSVRSDDEAVLIERVSPRRGADGVEYRVGGRMPLAATGGGLVLLAFAPEGTQAAAFDRFSVGGSVDGVDTADDLRRVLTDIRRTSSAVCTRALPRPMVASAVPIRNGRRAVVAALSVVMPAGEIRPQSLIPALQACSRGISSELRLSGERALQRAVAVMPG